MAENYDFSDIRPIEDSEVHEVIQQLLEEERFRKVIAYVYPGIPWQQFSEMLLALETKKQFQETLIAPFGWMLAEKVTRGLDIGGLENVTPENSYLYMSNHRDIVLDAFFLNILFHRNGFNITEVAIGDNLLIHPWIKSLVRLNKSFIVQRGVPVRQMLDVSKKLSAYIHYAIKDKGESIWIAQREGRSKDSNDRTQESLLKMLSLSGNDNFLDSIRSLNIVPASISYEYDPCDYLKAQEFHIKRDNPEYKKSQYEDLLSMETGIFGFKGRVHFQVCTPLNELLTPEMETLDRNECIRTIAELIDNQIHLNYKFYPCNYVAYDLLTGSERFTNKYTEAEKHMFEAYLNMQMDKIIRIVYRDNDFLRTRMLEMYANTLINHLSATEKQ